MTHLISIQKKKALLTFFTILFLLVPIGISIFWSVKAIEIANKHFSFQVSHHGWSFPAHVYQSDKSASDGKHFLGFITGKRAELREHLPFQSAPRHLIDAIISAEDSHFWSHPGVQLTGILRALKANILAGRVIQGASTINMQVAKNFLQSQERNLYHKIKEMISAVALTLYFGREKILQAYLDIPYLGQKGSFSICGFAMASKHYFGKPASQLTLSEAATLAAIIPQPGVLAPNQFPQKVQKVRDVILNSMKKNFNYKISTAVSEPVKTIPVDKSDLKPSPQLEAIRLWLISKYPEEKVYNSKMEVLVSKDFMESQDLNQSLLTSSITVTSNNKY